MQEQDVETELKVIVVGNGQVGKTSMITRFARGVWTDAYKKTIGTDFMEKEVFVPAMNETVKLMLWDTAGQEMFSKLTRNYYKGAGAVVYVFSTTDRDSFTEVERWRAKVEEECGPICSVLVQNKIDQLDKAAMKTTEVEDLARRMGLKLYRTCVRDNTLVKDVFEYVAESFLKNGVHSNSDIKAVADIGDLSNQNYGQNGKRLSGSANATPGTASTHSVAQAQANQPFKLEPSRKRTDGKKKFACSIL